MVPSEPREPEAEDKKKERVAAGAPFTWITWHFGTCLEEANEDEVKTYARVYMWYVVINNGMVEKTQTKIPVNVLHYMPIVPRLQRLFMVEETSRQMTWHKTGKRTQTRCRWEADDGAHIRR